MIAIVTPSDQHDGHLVRRTSWNAAIPALRTSPMPFGRPVTSANCDEQQLALANERKHGADRCTPPHIDA